MADELARIQALAEQCAREACRREMAAEPYAAEVLRDLARQHRVEALKLSGSLVSLRAAYPMTGPAYSAQRFRLAVDLGLGRQRSAVTEAVEGSTAPKETAELQIAQAVSSDIPATTEVLRQADEDDELDEGVTRQPFEDDGAAT